MKHFKKRTIALVLASVITVAGSFAAENYKNSLMSLKFYTASNGGVNMSVETKIPYSGNVNPVKRDDNTYILTLSEMNNFIKDEIKLENVSGNIQSVDVKTLPYTNNAKGYTRITIKTYNPINITSQNKIFIPSENNEQAALPTSQPKESINKEQLQKTNLEKVQKEQEKTASKEAVQKQNIAIVEKQISQNVEQKVSKAEENSPVSNEIQNYEPKRKDPFAALMLGLGILLVLALITAFGLRAKNKLQEITGERIDIDISDDNEEEKPKDKKPKQIKKVINELDSIYSKSAVIPSKEKAKSKNIVKTAKPSEELNVVDLDELFKEQKIKSKSEERKVDFEKENSALEDFLSGFSFDEEIEKPQPIQENKITYDEDYYNKVINKKELSFNRNDIDCINQLLHNEIDDEVLRNKERFAKKTPTPKVKKTPQQVLEELVTTYQISQNILFNCEDIEALKKLISVEIDPDFITDLRTNPERTRQIQEEINASRNRSRKPSEILTLSVKDMLPDLSEALKKQGNRRIKSEVKPITVYASEGYEVSTLRLNTLMPDLSKEIYNKSAYIEKPSADYEIVDNSYEVQTLTLKDSLPDLSEAIKNPKNFERPEPEKIEVDEESLLKNIANVQFKPFDDGTREFEILNEVDTPNNDEGQDKEENKERNSAKKVEETKSIRAERRERILQQRSARIKEKTEENQTIQPEIKCILDGVTYNVLSTTEFSENKGCHLAKSSNGYAVLGYIDDKFIKVTEFESLKSERIISRLSETLPDGLDRYIIRIGLNKFMVNVSDSDIEYMITL